MLQIGYNGGYMANKNKKKLDFASLYPTPKTYDEMQERNKASHVRWVERQPKHVAFITSINLSVAVMALAVVVSDPSIFLYVGIISGVSFMFLSGLIWFAFVGWQIMRLSQFFSYKGYSIAPFLLAYFTSAVPLLVSLYVYARPLLPLALIYALLTVLNIGLILLLTAIVTTKKRSDRQKIIMLSSIVLMSVVIAAIITII